MFTILVARPGLGKSASVNPAIEVLKESGVANVLSDRLTIEYILEKMAKGFINPAKLVSKGGVTGASGKDATALMYSSELSIFITASHATLPILADMWDARDGPWQYGTRHKGEYTITDGCLTFIACSSPKWLIDAIPDSAVGGGFTRRVNFVYAEKRSQFIPFPPAKNGSLVRTNLIEDLKEIAQLNGEFKLAKDGAEDVYEKFHKSCEADEFESEETASYITTQATHALKLAMVLSAGESDSLQITKPILERAIVEVKKCAEDLKYVFRASGSSDIVEAADRVMRFIELKGSTTRSDILRTCWRHVDSDTLDIVLRTFLQAQLITEQQIGHKTVYTDASKKKSAAGASKNP